MKNLKPIFALLILSCFFSCDADEDNDSKTTCESDFFGLQAKTSYINPTDSYEFGKYPKSTLLGIPSILSTGNIFSGATGWMQNYTSVYNATLNELTCLLPTNNELIKCNTITGTTTSITLSNVVAPVYIGSSTRILKYSNLVFDPISIFPSIISADLQIVDDSGAAISPIITKSFTSLSMNNIKSITSATDGTNIYYLANCELIIYNTITSTFSIKTIDIYDEDTNRKFYQGLELKDNNTLIALKQTVIPSTKIEISAIDISNLSLTTLPNIAIYNLTTPMLPAATPSLGVIINAFEYRTTTYDSCDNSYYFTYTSPSNAVNDGSSIYELKLNSASLNVYPGNGTVIFAIEKGQ